MPLRSLIARSIDPQPTSGRLSRTLTATTAESHEDDEHVDRIGPRNIFGRVDFADNDARPESGRKRKFLRRPAQPDGRFHVHI